MTHQVGDCHFLQFSFSFFLFSFSFFLFPSFSFSLSSIHHEQLQMTKELIKQLSNT
jgi:hypothetical protein